MANESERHRASGRPIGAIKSPKDDLFRWLSRRLPLCLAVVLTVTVLTTVLAYLTPPTYSATGVVLIERGKSPTMRSDPLLFRLEIGEVLSSEIGILESRGVAEEVVDRLGLADRPLRDSWLRRTKTKIEDTMDRLGLSVKLERRERTIRGVQKRLEIEQPAGTPLLSISFEADDPKYAAEVARAIVDVYIERHREIFTDNTAVFFKARLNDTEDELRSVRETLGRETARPRIDELELQLAALEATYLFYRDRWDRASADEAGDKSLVNVRPIDYPSVPQKPKRSRLFQIAQGFLVGLFLAIGIALVRDYFDHNIYGPSDVTSRLSVPLLGTVRKTRGHSGNGGIRSSGSP